MDGEPNGRGENSREGVKNWRDALDIQSFYFTRFPEEMREKEMWMQFMK